MPVLRDYDQSMVDALGSYLPNGQPPYVTDAPGLAAPVGVHFGLPVEWYTTYALPAINITRAAIVPDYSRGMQQFVGRELSTNPLKPNTFNVQKYPSVPVKLLYTVELVTESMMVMDALLALMLMKLPLAGYGTVLTVLGRATNFRHTGMRNLSDPVTPKGRKFRYQFDYTVDGWFTPSLECTTEAQILTVDVGVEVHDTGETLRPPPPPEPPPPLTDHIVVP